MNAVKKGSNLSLVEAKIPDVVRIYVYKPVFNEVFIPFSRIICLTSSFHFLDAQHYYDVVQHILSCYSIRIQIEISRRLSLLNKALLSPPQMEKVCSYKKLISRFDSGADKQWIVCTRIKKNEMGKI